MVALKYMLHGSQCWWPVTPPQRMRKHIMKTHHRNTSWLAAIISGLVLGGAFAPAHASSHREAPFLTNAPKVDGTDFYMFRSYAPGREGYVTMIANFIP